MRRTLTLLRVLGAAAVLGGVGLAVLAAMWTATQEGLSMSLMVMAWS